MKSKYPDMSIDELRNEENQLRTSLFNMRVGNTTKELQDTSQIRATRKDLARVLTSLRKKELEASAK